MKFDPYVPFQPFFAIRFRSRNRKEFNFRSNLELCNVLKITAFSENLLRFHGLKVPFYGATAFIRLCQERVISYQE